MRVVKSTRRCSGKDFHFAVIASRLVSTWTRTPSMRSPSSWAPCSGFEAWPSHSVSPRRPHCASSVATTRSSARWERSRTSSPSCPSWRSIRSCRTATSSRVWQSALGISTKKTMWTFSSKLRCPLFCLPVYFCTTLLPDNIRLLVATGRWHAAQALYVLHQNFQAFTTKGLLPTVDHTLCVSGCVSS